MTNFEGLYSIMMMAAFIMIGSCLIYEKQARISPTPVLPWVRKKALGLIPESFDRQGDYNIADLGSGWGGLLLKLAKRFPNSHISGYEISPWPYYTSKITSKIFTKNITVKNDNFFESDISKFDIVVCYLSPHHMRDLKAQFLGLKAGSTIISCSFPIEGWVPDRETKVTGIFLSIPIYVYTIQKEVSER